MRLLEQAVRVVGRGLADQVGRWVGVDRVWFEFLGVGWMQCLWSSRCGILNWERGLFKPVLCIC